MENKSYETKAHNLVKQARKKGLIKQYTDFSNSTLGKFTTLSEEETTYYTSKKGKKIYNIGDIVYVSNYTYKTGIDGQNHIFVIIDSDTAIDINYFGFLLSSKINKSTYQYNEFIESNTVNNLKKNSIVKCDDLIEIKNTEIQFKIGEVSEEDLERFINTYEKYLSDLN